MTTGEIEHVIGSFADVPLHEHDPEPAAVGPDAVPEFVAAAAAATGYAPEPLTWATPAGASLASALRLTPLLTVAPAAGSVIATLGAPLSGVTVKLLVALKSAPLVAVTVFSPEAVAPALQL